MICRHSEPQNLAYTQIQNAEYGLGIHNACTGAEIQIEWHCCCSCTEIIYRLCTGNHDVKCTHFHTSLIYQKPCRILIQATLL